MSRKMKDSGIGWVGPVPNDWNVIRGKYLFENDKDIVGSRVEDFERLALTMQGVIKRSKEDNEGLQPDKFDAYQILRTNELVFKLIDLQNVSTSRVGLSPYTGIVSPAYIILKAKNEIDPRFAEYYYLMMWMRAIFNQLGDAGVRSSLNASELLELSLPLPPLLEQYRIADFLDKKCSQIDEISKKLQEEIKTLEEYKKSVITEAVTKGLDPNVEMKDSGIEWIGEIPATWSVSKLGNVLRLRNERNSKPLEEVNLISLYTDKGVVQHSELEKTSGNKAQKAEGYKIVHKNDIVVNIILAWMGAMGISNYNGVTSPAYDVFKIDFNKIVPRYCHYVLRTPALAAECYKYGRGIMMMRWRTYSDEFKRIKMPLPSLDEQQHIADYLDKKCADIDWIVSQKKEQINYLDNYKKSLIYEYVTGKKEVAM